MSDTATEEETVSQHQGLFADADSDAVFALNTDEVERLAKIDMVVEVCQVDRKEAKIRLVWCDWLTEAAIEHLLSGSKAPGRDFLAGHTRLQSTSDAKKKRCHKKKEASSKRTIVSATVTRDLDVATITSYVCLAMQEEYAASLDGGMALLKAAHLRSFEDKDNRIVVKIEKDGNVAGVCVLAAVQLTTELAGVRQTNLVVDCAAFAIAESCRGGGLGRCFFEAILLSFALKDDSMLLLNHPRDTSRNFWEKLMCHWHEAPNEADLELWRFICNHHTQVGLLWAHSTEISLFWSASSDQNLRWRSPKFHNKLLKQQPAPLPESPPAPDVQEAEEGSSSCSSSSSSGRRNKKCAKKSNN